MVFLNTGPVTSLDLMERHFQRGVGRGVHNVSRRKHHGAEPKSGTNDADSDTDGHCDMIWAKAGCGCGVCALSD